MFKNYLKIAYRSLLKYKAYSFINIAGLSIGMACCILILLYVQDELSYDKWHENADRTFRVTREWLNDDGKTNLHLGHVAPPIAPLMKQDFPEVEEIVRITGGSSSLVSYDSKHFSEDRFYFADPNIFKIFSIELIEGDPETILQQPLNVILSEDMATKYFGAEEPLGKSITYRERVEFKVAGIMKNTPRNSHFHFDFLGSMLVLENFFGQREFQSWGSNNYATYLLLPPNYDKSQLEGKFPEFMDRHLTAAIIRNTGQEPTNKPSERNLLHLQALTDIHLHSQLDSEIEANGNIVYVYIFTAVAGFILLIACINFMNLATARSANRAKEVGLRKVVGADRKKLIRQFLSETVFMAFVSLIFGLVMVYATLPWFSGFVSRELALNLTDNLGALLGLAGLMLFVGLAAGSYPAFYLSKFQPIVTLKGMKKGGANKSAFRTILVVFQFAISIVLIISMGVVGDQLEYCRTKDLGLNKDNVVVFAAGQEIIQRYADVKNQLLQHPNIIGVAASKRVPSGRLLDSSGGRVIEGETQRPLNFRIASVQVDHDFVDTYGMRMVAGRNFSVDFPTDSTEAFILNEVAVERIGWASPEEAIGKPFRYGSRDGRIIGVVNNFNYESLHQPITPILMWIRPQNFNSISIRIRPTEGVTAASVVEGFLTQKWLEFRPNFPPIYSFLDERYDQLYGAEHRLEQIFTIFSGLAVFIACLGLFGLASYIAEQRTKEIGIRKVLGASVSNITLMLSKHFSLLVAAATPLAWLVAWFVMDRWLGTFAFRVDISLFVFAWAALLAFGIAISTVSFQSIKAALINPVNSLRNE